jgi:glycosyltransferase involved in cell wall biosynthesis
MFPPTPAPPSSPPTILFVGVWSLQKGCDVLSDAWLNLPEARLMHVGPAGDAAFPKHPSFVHHDPVPQWKLKEFFGRAHVLALASRQEGLSLVQAQALACGLPVVCTTRTGGEDLQEFLANPSLVTVVRPDDSNALAKALGESLKQAVRVSGLRDYLGGARNKLSWRAYGERYDAELGRRAAPMKMQT